MTHSEMNSGVSLGPEEWRNGGMELRIGGIWGTEPMATLRLGSDSRKSKL